MKAILKEEAKINRIKRVGLRENESADFPILRKLVNRDEYWKVVILCLKKDKEAKGRKVIKPKKK